MADAPNLALAPVFEGWNVWAVDQLDDLSFDPLDIGLDRDRRLRIWVEDQVRLNAPGTSVADPLDLKGSQVQIIAGDNVTDLVIAQSKEQVPGPPMLLDGANERRIVRFFNHGAASSLPWPHDSDYILDAVYKPDPKASETAGPAPRQIAAGTADDAKKAAGQTTVAVLWVVGGVAALALGVVAIKAIAERALASKAA